MDDFLKRWWRTGVVDLPVLIVVTLAALLYCYEFEVFPHDQNPYAVEPDEVLLVLIISCCGLVICSFRALTAQRGDPSRVAGERASSNCLPLLRTLSLGARHFLWTINRRDILPTLSKLRQSAAAQTIIGSIARSGEVGPLPELFTIEREASLKKLTRDEWDMLARSFSDLSYRQCSSYAVAAAKNVGAQPEFIGIFDGQKLIGLANVRVKTLPLAFFGLAYINYGPLTARSSDFSPALFGNCLSAISKEYVVRRRLVLRIVPPLRGGVQQEAQAACLEAHGFRPLTAPYASRDINPRSIRITE